LNTTASRGFAKNLIQASTPWAEASLFLQAYIFANKRGYNLQIMRSIEAFAANPLFGLCVALVLVVIGTKLSTEGEQIILIIAWCLFVLSVFRTRPISEQVVVPRILLALFVSSIAGLGLCLITGWRPLLSRFPLNLFAIVSDGDYPDGTNLGNIAWSTRFSDLRVVVTNQTDFDYRDVDLTLQPDVPIAAIGQISNLPDVSFSPVADSTVSVSLIDGVTKKQRAIPLVLVASDGGYRVRCGLLPHKRKLEVVIAVAEIIDFPKPGTAANPGGGVLQRNYVLKLGSTGDWYGYGTDAKGRIEDIYKGNKPIPKIVRINGSYTVNKEEEAVSQLIEAKDLVGDFLKQKIESH
jgi:hypothetical protein